MAARKANHHAGVQNRVTFIKTKNELVTSYFSPILNAYIYSKKPPLPGTNKQAINMKYIKYTVQTKYGNSINMANIKRDINSVNIEI